MKRQTDDDTSAESALAASPKDAAKALGISARTLWTYTRRNAIPHVRIGRRILYPIDELRRWMRDNVVLPA